MIFIENSISISEKQCFEKHLHSVGRGCGDCAQLVESGGGKKRETL
jgi:hypothetical protein